MYQIKAKLNKIIKWLNHVTIKLIIRVIFRRSRRWKKWKKASIESPEYVFNTWLKEKCNESEMIVVNDIPFLVDDCIEILKGI